jgi:pimeloyl-ACP methyl ester carboxylesterase
LRPERASELALSARSATLGEAHRPGVCEVGKAHRPGTCATPRYSTKVDHGGRQRRDGHKTDGHRPKRRRRWLIGAGIVVVVLLVAVPIGIAWGASGLLLTPHHDITTAAGSVVKVGSGEVVLQRRTSTLRVGEYGLVYPGGRAIVGDISATTANAVTRPLSSVSGTLTAGTKVQIDPDVWGGDPESSLGIPYKNVDVDGQLGEMPAWQVDGAGSTWLIFVHGIDGKRQGGLRPMSTIAASGIPSLYITYRNDVGAPKSADGLFHLGDTEWRDLDAAVQYAKAHGAQKFILYGDSMGGSIVTQFIHRSKDADRVIGMVLDAPVLNWSGVLDNQANRLKLGLLAPLVLDFVSARANISLSSLDELDQTSAFTMPIILFQGLADPLVPPAESEEFAEKTGATYVPVPKAGHIQSWNVNPGSYESHLASFLAGVLHPSGG